MADTLTATHVLDYLHEHPDFLTDYLAKNPQAIPLQSGNVVNFQQMMVTKLRQDKERSESRQRMMIDNARANMTVQARMHAAVLRVVEARNWEELIEVIANEVSLMLQVDVISILFEQPRDKAIQFPSNTLLLAPGTIDTFLGEHDNVLQTNVTGDARLFGGAARLVKSQALLRLNVAEHIPDGMIAFGSRDPLMFADSQGTELVGFLADVIERMLRHF